MVGIREEEEDVGSVEDVGMRKTPAQVEISQLFDQGEFRQSADVDISGRRDNAQRTNPDDGLRPTDGRRRCCVPWIQTIYDETANHYNFSLISITNKVIISDITITYNYHFPHYLLNFRHYFSYHLLALLSHWKYLNNEMQQRRHL